MAIKIAEVHPQYLILEGYMGIDEFGKPLRSRIDMATTEGFGKGDTIELRIRLIEKAKPPRTRRCPSCDSPAEIFRRPGCEDEWHNFDPRLKG